jgi:hypothetical protein
MSGHHARLIALMRPIDADIQSAAQNPQDFLELDSDLTHDLLRLGEVVSRLIALQPIASPADREALLI